MRGWDQRVNNTVKRRGAVKLTKNRSLLSGLFHTRTHVEQTTKQVSDGLRKNVSFRLLCPSFIS